MNVHNEILRTIARNCRLFGVEEDAVYRAANVNPGAIAIADGMHDWKTGVNIWNAALALTAYPYISLTFGKEITFSVLGWIAPLATSSNTLKSSLKNIVDFFPLMGNMFTYEFLEHPNGDATMYYRPAATWEEYSPETALLAAEHAMALTVSLSSFLCGKKIPVRASIKQHTDTKRLELYSDFFSSTETNAQEYALHFEKAVVNTPCITANPVIYQNMLQICEEQLQKIKTESGIRSEVLRIFHSRQAYYVPKINEVAAMLNISARTLQRKLKEENTGFHQLLEEFQIGMAQHLLQKPEMQVQEIAFMLGFSSPQSFSKTYKRRTGKTPKQMADNR